MLSSSSTTRALRPKLNPASRASPVGYTQRVMLLSLILSCLGACRGAGPDRPADAPRHDIQWGIYRIYWPSRDYAGDMAALVARHPTSPDFVMFYRDLGNLVFPHAAVKAIRSVGSTPVISLELGLWHDGQSKQLPRLLEGAYDAELTSWAQDAREEGGPILLRFGFEMNGDWFSWSGSPKDYIAAWRHAHQIFQSAGAQHVEWVWTPNIVSVPDLPGNDIHLYYPGHDVVDRVGFDGYNFGDAHDQWHTWQSFSEVFDEPLWELAERYPDKPIFVGETGSAPGGPGQRARWVRDAWRSLARHPTVTGVVWFDLDKRREGEPDWRLDSEADTLQAFNESFAAPEKESRAKRPTPSEEAEPP